MPQGICRIQNPDIPRAGSGGVAHGGAAGQSGAGQDRTPTGRSVQETTAHLAPRASRALKNTCPETNVLLNSKPGHTTGESGRGGARWDGGAGRGRAGRDDDGSVCPGNNRPSYSPDDRIQPSWACLWKHEQRKPYVGTKPAVDDWSITGLSAVYLRDHGRSSFPVAGQCTDA